MQPSETRGRAPPEDLGLNLSPPVRLDLWALLLALGIVAGTIAPPLAVAFVLASAVVSAGVALREGLVPEDWRAMALLSPLFVAGGVGVALLHATASDPLRELAALEPGEVVVVGRISSPPVPTGFGYRADLRVEHLWYEDKEVLRGGGVQVYAGDLPFGVGDRLRVDGELTRPEVGEDGFDYGRYLSTYFVTQLHPLEAPVLRAAGRKTRKGVQFQKQLPFSQPCQLPSPRPNRAYLYPKSLGAP